MTIEGSKCDDPPEPATERPSRAVVGHDLFVTHQLPEDELVRTVRRSATTSASDARQELALVAPGLIEALKGDSDGFRLSEPQELAKSLACHLDRSLTFAETSSPKVELLGNNGDEFPLREQVFQFVRATPDRVAAAFAEGLSLMVRSADEEVPELAKLAGLIERSLGVSTRADVVVIPLGQEVTLAGTDQLTLAATVLGHTRGHPDDEGQHAPGEGWTVPPASPLKMSAISEFVLAVVFRLPAITLNGLAQAVAPFVVRHPLLRADLPRSLSEPIHSYGGSVAADDALLRRELTALCSSESLQAAIERHLATMPPRPSSSFFENFETSLRPPEEWRLRSTMIAGIQLVRGQSGTIAMAAANQVVELSELDMMTLAVLSDGRTHSMPDLLDRLGSPSILDVENVVRWALIAGWIEFTGVRR